MNYDHGDCIVDTMENKTKGVRNFYRIIETQSEGNHLYSLFVSTDDGKNIYESFVFDIARNLNITERLCKYLCKKQVCASSLPDILSDCIGSEKVSGFPEFITNL